jgi:hypothetical protein
MQAVSRDTGVISTDWYSFPLEKLGSGKIKLNILVYDAEEGGTAMSVRMKGAWDNEGKSLATEKHAQAEINNRAALLVRDLFLKIGEYVGEPSLKGTYTLELE